MKALVLLNMLTLSACATYHTAENVKLVSFDDNPTKGSSIGNIRGEDCTWVVLGYQLGGMPTVDRAFMNARKGIDGGTAAAGITSGTGNRPDLRYVNNVTTKNEGFNAGVVAKNCIAVTGVGYR